MEDSITLSYKERKQIPVLEQLIRSEVSQQVASQLLNLSTRQVRRRVKKYLKGGVRELAHKNRGRPSKRRVPNHKREQIIKLYREKYSDFGPTFASEKLKEEDGVLIKPETLRLLLIKEKLWIKKRKRLPHKSWRPPKEFCGELVQLDGSDHDWFEGRGSRCTLLGFIDDATNKVFLEFSKSESHESLMTATKHYCLINGKPLAFYVDRGKVFKVNVHNQDNEFKTQYERALAELDIKISHAYSPAAKGRIERLFETLQDRLVKEMRLKCISDIRSANQYLQNEYICKHNRRFARMPAQACNLHRAISSIELDNALCLKETRRISNDFTIRYKNRLIQLKKAQNAVVRPKEEVQIWENFEGKITLFVR
jgi:transposase